MYKKGGCKKLRVGYKTKRLSGVFICLLFCSLFSIHTWAQLELGVTAHVEHIDNPQRLNESDGEEDILSQISLNAGYEQVTRWFVSDINYQARKLEYKNDSLDDRALISGEGSIVWVPLPDFFSWNVSNSRTFQAQDTSIPDNTDNRQIVNTVSTGPLLTIRMGAANKLDLQLNYSLADFERVSTFSQSRKAVNASLVHLFSPRLTAGIRLSKLDSDFDENEAFNFERESVAIIGSITNVNYNLNVELGRNEIKRKTSGDWDNLLLKLDGSYTINNSSKVNAAYSRSGEDLLSNLDISPQESDAVLDTNVGNSNQTQVYQLIRTSLAYTYTVPSSIVASVRYSRLLREYDVSLDDQENKNISIQATWPISQKLNMTLFGRRSDLFFAVDNRSQQRNELGFRGNYTISQKFSVRFSVLHTKQDSNLLLDNYDGMNSFVAITYRH